MNEYADNKPHGEEGPAFGGKKSTSEQTPSWLKQVSAETKGKIKKKVRTV